MVWVARFETVSLSLATAKLETEFQQSWKNCYETGFDLTVVGGADV